MVLHCKNVNILWLEILAVRIRYLVLLVFGCFYFKYCLFSIYIFFLLFLLYFRGDNSSVYQFPLMPLVL